MDNLKNQFIENKEFELRRNKSLVSMNKGGDIEIEPNSDDKKIYTHGVNGCTVTAIYSLYEDGSQKGTLTHFEPVFIKENLDSIKKPDRIPTKIEATIFVNYDQKNDDELSGHLKKNAAGALSIKKHLQDIFGLVDVKIIPYELTDDLKESREISLVIKSKKENKEPLAELHWWKGEIKL